MNKPLLIVLLMLLPTAVANACIWDRDTLAMERARFPEVNELIVGYFPRHSPVYYEWRKEQVLAVPVQERTPADYDDLGASYDKLGDHDKAIQIMIDKIERFPTEGLYETHANLGTFYIHNGDLEQGVQYIGSAIEINPEAHFGREVYQKLLVEYVIAQRATGNVLPLERYPDHNAFSDFVVKEIEYEDRDAEIKRAIKGVLGMMRFGNYDSPILLEVLGDLLSKLYENDNGVQRLAARAYLKAAYEVEDKAVIDAYRAKAQAALEMQEDVVLSDIEIALQREIAKGDAYYAQIEADEQAWAKAGEDLDERFADKYYDESASLNAPELGKTTKGARDRFVFAAMGMATIVAMGVIASFAVRTRKKKSA